MGRPLCRHSVGDDPSAASNGIRISVNGEPRLCTAGLTLPMLLAELGYRPELVVVEFNGEILQRSLWQGQRVGEADVLEVVTIVGGGS